MASRQPVNRWQIMPYWRAIVTLIIPLLLLPLPILSKTQEARCGYVILVMALFWMTEAVPLAITALIPVFGFPLLGVMSTGELCMMYMKETNMMFLGGLTVAIAVEHCNLHKRIALFVILHVGQSPRRLMFGFMMTTMFLSMWISNTASTAMMVPIVDAILQELYKKEVNVKAVDDHQDEHSIVIAHTGEDVSMNELIKRKRSLGSRNSSIAEVDSNQQKQNDVINQMANNTDVSEQEEPKQDNKIQLSELGLNMRKALMLSVAYSANIGGTGVVTGTSPNLILMANLNQFDEPTGLNFATWMGYNVPGMIICVLLAWGWLQLIFIGWRNNAMGETNPAKQREVKKLIQHKYRSLGPMTFHETVVLTLFIFLVFLWLFRAPEFVKGWAYWFKLAFGDHVLVQDATPAMLIVFLLFVIPKKLDFWMFRNPQDRSPVRASEGCLTWQVVHEKIPWGVVLLLGGGFAMAEAADQSNLSAWLGEQLKALTVMPDEAIVFVVCLMTAMVTEVASNTATASILIPVLKELSIGIKVNPLYLMLPATICCSYAFMLPVATPPNAIVFAAANMNSMDMIKTGFMMNVICVCVAMLMINTWGIVMFDIKNFPDWANVTESAY